MSGAGCDLIESIMACALLSSSRNAGMSTGEDSCVPVGTHWNGNYTVATGCNLPTVIGSIHVRERDCLFLNKLRRFIYSMHARAGGQHRSRSPRAARPPSDTGHKAS